ncbi:aminoglycoside phosphotransferase family protein [Salipaludibacillus sp. CUR1]|uniref:aminoglycoside phosphotransferase family protein n=1 Tax=Salipaludibacillus sp. CUR1 TaxID=2820003 RepID=UPI001E434DCB|nr:aminoglycoside phosphotransferase family protein [Salipaludibacillus sp. CUR1]MCE7793785.1 aminoglycoside phosphotransferase family protein [Salipaludibacillus sp. CUR1]
MDIQKIINQLLHNNIIPSKPTEYKHLSGGTASKVYLLTIGDIKYAVKSNQPQVIKSEVNFLNLYKESNLLPELLFVESSYKYIVYTFINGTANYVRKNKKEMLKLLVQQLLNNYKPVPNDIGWGWADDPADSWQSFLLDEIGEAYEIINSRLVSNDHDFVFDLVQKCSNERRKPFLLHGDCGVHNFIFKDGHLNGVIDPAPVIGDPLYDLIYAFCSSPDDLTKETIDSAVSHLRVKPYENNLFLYNEVIIGLYLRLGTCIKHHPNDFEEYLKAWHYWKDTIKSK